MKLLRLVLWPPPRFLLHTLERELNDVGSSLVTTDDTGCFDASWHGMNTRAADFL